MLADEFEKIGAEQVCEAYGMSPARIPFLVKDPRGFAEFNACLLPSTTRKGGANTMRGFQAARPSLYEFEAEIRRSTCRR